MKSIWGTTFFLIFNIFIMLAAVEPLHDISNISVTVWGISSQVFLDIIIVFLIKMETSCQISHISLMKAEGRVVNRVILVLEKTCG